MNRAVVNTLFCVLLTSSLIGLFFLSYIAKDKRGDTLCQRIEIEFADSLKFIDEDNVLSYLDKYYGSYIGEKIDSVNLHQIEQIFERRNSIIGSQAWITDDGVLHLKVKQRYPVMRFMDGQRGFYIDSEGYIFPLHKTYTADVRLIEGKIPVKESPNYSGYPTNESDKEWIDKMLRFNDFLNSERVVSSKIENIYIIDNGDIALKMQTNEELFIFGDITRFKEKMKMIDTYFKHISEVKDYKTVNLKYKNQIICRTDI